MPGLPAAAEIAGPDERKLDPSLIYGSFTVCKIATHGWNVVAGTLLRKQQQ